MTHGLGMGFAWYLSILVYTPFHRKKINSPLVIPTQVFFDHSIRSIAMGRTLVYPKVPKNTVHRKDSRGKRILRILEIIGLVGLDFTWIHQLIL